MVVMREWRLTPFEHSGAVHSGLRSGFCLAGYSWDKSDATATDIVDECLRLLGAKRPSWKEGQREYVVPREFCANINCQGPLDVEDMTNGKRFCCKECATATKMRNQNAFTYFNQKQLASAFYIAQKATIPERPCAECGNLFKPATLDAKFCSRSCVERSQPDFIPERACKKCGTIFHPQTRAVEFCSVACRFEYRLPERDCLECGKSFAPNKDHARFCSKICSTKNYQRKHAADRIFPEKACECCGEMFTPRSTCAKYCGKKCRDEGRWVILPIRPCAFCGENFLPKNDQAKFCSPKCNQRTKDARQKAKRDAARAAKANSDSPIQQLFDVA